jgi:hypothetical protein
MSTKPTVRTQSSPHASFKDSYLGNSISEHVHFQRMISTSKPDSALPIRLSSHYTDGELQTFQSKLMNQLKSMYSSESKSRTGNKMYDDAYSEAYKTAYNTAYKWKFDNERRIRESEYPAGCDMAFKQTYRAVIKEGWARGYALAEAEKHAKFACHKSQTTTTQLETIEPCDK